MVTRRYLLLVGFWLACTARERATGTSDRASPPRATEPPTAATTPAPSEASAKPVEVPVERVSDQTTREAHQAALKRLGIDALDDNPLVHYVPLEHAAALERFYRVLREFESNVDPQGKLRILVYGSSSVATDRYTGYLRAYLQHRFGDGGPGFVALVPLWRWHRHEDVDVSGRGWTIEHAVRKSGRMDGLYGLLGASASADRAGAQFELDLKKGREVHRLEVWALGQPGGARLALSSNRGAEPVLDTKRPQLEAIYHALDPAPRSRLRGRVEGEGEVRLFGAVLERPDKGVVVDELGVGGTEAGDHLTWVEPIWRDNIQRRNPALYVLAYGANAAGKDDLPMEQYRAELAQVLRRFQTTLPDAACLLIGPADFYAQDDAGTWQVEPRIEPVLQIQRELAQEHGCALWDTRAFMGGRETMAAWTEAGLARSDHLHFTPLGYTHMGAMLTDALMAPFDAEVGEEISNASAGAKP